MSRDKQNEIHELAKQMSEAISTAVEQRYIEDEAKLQAVLIENGWRKASEVALEVIYEIEKIIEKFYNMYCFKSDLDDIEIDAVINFSDDISSDLAELKKKYTEN